MAESSFIVREARYWLSRKWYMILLLYYRPNLFRPFMPFRLQIGAITHPPGVITKRISRERLA